MTDQTREQQLHQIIEALFAIAVPGTTQNALWARYLDLTIGRQEETASTSPEELYTKEEERHAVEVAKVGLEYVKLMGSIDAGEEEATTNRPDAHELDDEEMAREAAYWRKVQGQEEAAAAAAEPQEPTQS
jgi:hypothetical protein